MTVETAIMGRFIDVHLEDGRPEGLMADTATEGLRRYAALDPLGQCFSISLAGVATTAIALHCKTTHCIVHNTPRVQGIYN